MNGLETTTSDIVRDPVGHISISGVHGGDELNERLERARDLAPVTGSRPGIGVLLAGVMLGAALALVIGRARRRGTRQTA